MKFKKVEISAFRIYDNPQNATFDLTTDSGSAAGFVSLYAPNGFGKTSFYDAVEYGMTESVDRFYLRASELEKMANLQSLDKFIRHTNSERDTYVKLYTDSAENPIIERSFTKHGNQKHDLNLDPKRRKEHPFQKVILSQEWISAFLIESDGEYRYRKFMEIPELSPIDNYYSNLKNLQTAYAKKVEELNSRIVSYKNKIQSIGDDNLLETINNQIILLNDKYGEATVRIINLSTTQEEIIKFKDAISAKVVSSNRESILNALLDCISTARTGNDSILGISAFFDALRAKEEDAKSVDTKKTLINKFDLLEELCVTIDNIAITQQDIQKKKDEVVQILSFFDEYLRLTTAIQEKNNLTIKEKNDLNNVRNQLEALHRMEIEKQEQQETVLRRLEVLNAKKAILPETKIQLDQLNKQIRESDAELNKKNAEIERLEKARSEAEIDILKIQAIIEEISNEQYSQISINENHEIGILIRSLEEKGRTLSTLRDQQKRLEATIQEQHSLNSTFVEFIKSGLVIVEAQKTSHCPLCDQAYKSYSELVERVTNNKALDQSLKILLGQQNSIDLLLFECTSEIKEEKEKLIKLYSAQLDALVNKNLDTDTSLLSLKKGLETLVIDLDKQNKKRGKYIVELGGVPLDEFEKQLDKDIETTNQTKSEIALEFAEVSKEIDKYKEVKNVSEKRIELLQQESEDLEQREHHRNVVKWFKENLGGQSIDKKLLTEREIFLTDSIMQLVTRQKKAEQEISALNAELTSFKKETLLLESSELEKRILENDTRIIAYQYFLRDKLGIDQMPFNEVQLSEILEQKRIEYRTQLEKATQVLEEYKKLEKYSENIQPFLQSENAKLDLNTFENELLFLNEKVKPAIEREREKVKVHLNERIKNFFYEGLINDLYRKIDPHPDFKHIEFRANFDTDYPRLDVFVRNNKNEDLLIPNLYFSTAQINILSLSIFLATALNSKEYQCIFIDDPIQSMDSINVLSTIDLLRSIVVNQGKQIILSTHDENFHKLLKKKMPPDLFESKFLELESFGKVKHE